VDTGQWNATLNIVLYHNIAWCSEKSNTMMIHKIWHLLKLLKPRKSAVLKLQQFTNLWSTFSVYTDSTTTFSFRGNTTRKINLSLICHCSADFYHLIPVHLQCSSRLHVTFICSAVVWFSIIAWKTGYNTEYHSIKLLLALFIYPLPVSFRTMHTHAEFIVQAIH